MKKWLSILLCITMLTMMFAGCGGTDGASAGGSSDNAQTQDAAGSSDGDGDSDSGSGAADGEWGSYLIASGNWGVGAYPLDIIFVSMRAMTDTAGVQLDVSNNEFTADKVISDLQNQIAGGADAVAFLGIAQALFPSMAQLCEDSGIPFVFFSNMPTDADLPTVVSNPYFAGMVVSNQYSAGVQIAERALADGNRTAIISAAAIGDFSHDQRVLGFTDTFEAGGGEVVYVSHSADPSEGVQKANDFMTAYPDADMVYGTGGDYSAATLSAMEGRNDINYKIYGTDVSPDIAEAIVAGDIVCANGLQYAEGSIAATLLVNYLDGHQILDSEGNPPQFTHLNMVEITQDNAQAYIDFMATGANIISDEEFQSLLYRHNRDVDYQTYYDFVSDYEQIVARKFA